MHIVSPSRTKGILLHDVFDKAELRVLHTPCKTYLQPLASDMYTFLHIVSTDTSFGLRRKSHYALHFYFEAALER